MHALAYYLHHLDPYIFRIGVFGPRYYGVAYLLGFFFAYLLLKKQSRDGMLRLHPQLVPDFVLNSCIFGVLLGGRLGFVLFYDLPDALKNDRTPLLWNFTPTVPFWGVLKVWDGGMAAHGGVVFTILVLIWMARRFKVSVVNLGDAACMVVPIGLFFGRIANFINGELYGHPTTVPWAVKFPSEIYAPTNGQPFEKIAELQAATAEQIFQHPEGLSLQQVSTFLDHHPDLKAQIVDRAGTLNLEQSTQQLETARMMISQKLHAFQEPLLPQDFAAWWQGAHNEFTQFLGNTFDTLLPARHPSQLYEALSEGLLLFVVCYTIGRKWRKDGMASGAFLTLYPIMRIIGEQFRVGDTAVNGNLGAGIIYSLPMFLAGAIYWAYWIKRDRRISWVPQLDIPIPPAESAVVPPPEPDH